MQQNNRNITEFSFLNTMIDNVISDIHPSRIETHVNNLTRVRIPDTFIEESASADPQEAAVGLALLVVRRPARRPRDAVPQAQGRRHRRSEEVSVFVFARLLCVSCGAESCGHVNFI